jgi:chromosome segregation protein
MKLASIKLAGFKSFVEPTKIEFPNHLTAIVGPNGCGKSNVIDAVRWVMGESSAKHLRGESMDDVIFNGSTSRQPVGQASVELQFNDCLGKLSGEYADYHDIAVKRVVTRDGQSQFFLNGVKCRRKDITHIFLGTGLGARSYSIIEQGMISRMIEAKPEELRAYLEEAAGISKYKERRRETENRIKHTHENLQRVTDIVQELEQQLTKLQRQAKAAERYKVLREQERLSKAQLQALRYLVLQSQLTEHTQQTERYTTEQTALQARMGELAAQIEQLHAQHTSQQDEWQAEQQQFYQLGSDITRLEQMIEHQRQRQQQLQQDIAQAQAELSAAEQELQRDQQQVMDLSQVIEQLTPRASQQSTVLQQHEQIVTDQEEALAQWQSQWEAFQQQHAKANQTAQVAQTNIQHVEQRIEQLQKRIATLQAEPINEQLPPLEQTIEQHQNDITQAQQQQTQAQQQLNTLKDRLHTQKQHNQQHRQQLDEVKHQLRTLSGEQTSLQTLQQAALGQHDRAAQQWLGEHHLADNKRLAETLTVAPGWEAAVEAVLGDDLQAICIDDLPTVAALTERIEAGKFSFISQTTARQVTTGVTQSHPTLASQITCDQVTLPGWLEQIYLAEDLPAALNMRATLTAGASIVTRQGIWLGANWLRVNRASDASAGVLQRKARLQELADNIAQANVRLSELQTQMADGEQQLATLEQQRDEQQQQVNQYNRQLAEQQAQLQLSQQQRQQLITRAEQVQREAADLQQQASEQQGKLQDTRHTWQQALNELEAHADTRQTLADGQHAIKAKLTEYRDLAREAREDYHQLQVQIQSAQSQIKGLQEHSQRAKNRMDQLQQRLTQQQQAYAEISDPSQDHSQRLQEQLQLKAAAEQRMTQAKTKLDELAHQLEQQQHQQREVELGLQELMAKLQQSQMAAQEAKVRATTITEAIDEMGFSLAELLAGLPQALTQDSCQQTIDQLERQIQRLGAINLAAIDECQTAAERHQYLTSQYEDLTEALTTLQQAIHKIDKETRERFKETFNTVDRSFRESFPRLFGGGQAYLQLTGEDLLDTGVTVIAQPPGKCNSSIHLLSGGEKAMTAVALVFAIFQLNPSPFCLLDEVDAPLDDANVSRFCALVKEMSAEVQFIFITHNKVTMELADYLSGVTMPELGVSTIVSVDMTEAVALAEQKAA